MNQISAGEPGTPESFALVFLLLLLFLLASENDIMYHRICLTIHSILTTIQLLSCDAVPCHAASPVVNCLQSLLPTVQKSNVLVLSPAASWSGMIRESFRQQNQKVRAVACLWGKTTLSFLTEDPQEWQNCTTPWRGREGKASATAAVIL